VGYKSESDRGDEFLIIADSNVQYISYVDTTFTLHTYKNKKRLLTSLSSNKKQTLIPRKKSESPEHNIRLAKKEQKMLIT
jgi:hypothetical protein